MELRLLNAAPTFTELRLIKRSFNSYGAAFHKFSINKKKKKQRKTQTSNTTEAHSQQQKNPHSQLKLRSITLFSGLSNKPSLSTPRRHRCLSSTPPPLREPIATVARRTDCHCHRLKPLCQPS